MTERRQQESDKPRPLAQRIKAAWQGLLGGGPRVAGPPPSPNRASSFHLLWRMPPAVERGQDGLTEVSAVLEILTPPTVPALYFWALQVDFVLEGRVVGGAHAGLQWNRRYPGGTAVNWGGYATAELGGAVLEGSRSELVGFPDDPNTLGYAWLPQRPYRLRVFPSPDRALAWRAEVTDLSSGETAAIRDLYLPIGGARGVRCRLQRPIVWSEVFADCDAPSVTVRWSALRAVTERGIVVRPEALVVNYQSEADGGCSNTDVQPDERGYLQITNVPRRVRQGTVLPVR